MSTLARVLMLLCCLSAVQTLAQDGTCRVGYTCRAYGLQQPCYATASLPTCSTSVKGRLMCDATQNCQVYCNGSAWSCVATSATVPSTGWVTDGGSTYTTPALLRVEIGGAGLVSDGGIRLQNSDLVCVGATGTAVSIDLGNQNNNPGGRLRLWTDPATINAIEFRSPGSSTLLGYIYPDATKVCAVHGPIQSESSKVKGSKVLVAGTGTVTVLSGSKCVCSNETTPTLPCGAPVSGTTLTVTSGVGTDTVSYICL